MLTFVLSRKALGIIRKYFVYDLTTEDFLLFFIHILSTLYCSQGDDAMVHLHTYDFLIHLQLSSFVLRIHCSLTMKNV